MRRVDLVVFDLDNTLYDWYASFLPAFYAMVDEIVLTLKCDRETLLDELRGVHRKYHDVEHPFSVMETPTVQAVVERLGQAQTLKTLDQAFHEFNRVRKTNLVLFPGALNTLEALRSQEIKVVAFTDSSYHSTLRRIRQLSLSDVFQHIFCRAKSESVVPVSSFAAPTDALDEKTIELPAHETKPNPAVLIDIAARESVPVSHLAYIGDSISKDVLMAKKAGCFSVWAKYGVRRDPAMYESLARISHWTDDDIKRERDFVTEASKISPDFICETSISQILTVLGGPSLARQQASE